MIGIDLTYISKKEAKDGFFSEGVSIYCEEILREFVKEGKSRLFVLLVFEDQEKTIRNLFPEYSIRVIHSFLVSGIRKIIGNEIGITTCHRYMKKIVFPKQVADLDCIWFPFACQNTFVKCNVPVVSTVHDLIMYHNGDWKVKWKYKNEVIKLSDRIVTISKVVKDDIVKTFDYLKAIDIIANPVALNVDSDIEVVDEVASPQTFILDINAFAKRKNTMTLLKAYKIIKDDVAEDLVLCGGYKEDDYCQEIQKYIIENGLSERVHVYLGIEVEKRNYLFKNASLFVMPSSEEGFGRTPVEAAMFGIPVICSDIPVLKEVMLGGCATFFSPIDDEKELAEVMLQKLKKQKNAEKLAEIAYKLNLYYSPEKCAREYIKIF